MATVTNLKRLYEIDDSQWLAEMIELLKQRQFENLDLKNLIEELTDLGSEKKNAVVSLLEQVIRYLLLLEYWTAERENNQAHWESEIVGFRTQLRRRLTTNLRNYLAKELPSIYQDAVIYVRTKTRFKIDFPETCLYSLDQLLDINFLSHLGKASNNDS
jgi:hypothetical protein